MFIKIPSFGIAKFCDLNKIINLHTAMLFQTNFINLINWVDSKLKRSNKLKEKLINTNRLYNNLRKNLNVTILDLCTLASQNYVNDMVIESVLRIFKAFKYDNNKNNNFILAPIYLYTYISDGKLDIAYNLLVVKLDLDTKKNYFGDSLYYQATIDLITNINRLFEFYGISFEDEVYYIGEIPYQCGTLDSLIESKFPSLQSYSTEIDDECKTIEIDKCEKIEIDKCEKINECETIKIDNYSMEVDGYEHMSMDNGCFETNQDISERIGVIELSLSKCWGSLNNAIADVKKYAYEQGVSTSIESSREYGVYLRLPVESNSKTQGIHITKIENTHNHQITPNEIEYYSYKSVDKEIWDEIELYVGQKLGLPQIRVDAAELYKMFIDRKNINPEWFVEFYVDNDTRRLNRIFWMNPVQLKKWYKYNDIVIIDTTYKTNKFNMILCFVLGVNNEGQSIILCQSLLDNESLENFNWFFKCLKSAVSDSPKILIRAP
ncbi:5267_t:CDS:2 [Entrophospora sp. SA101]|nr:5267_t:CDS:2 [Entrophospora sp. SA101]